MGELADEMSAAGKKNIWGNDPEVVELQSEGEPAARYTGLSAGCPSTTLPPRRGLMLMLPNMSQIAGELTSTVFHVSARSLACQALSIFGDHSDVMAAAPPVDPAGIQQHPGSHGHGIDRACRARWRRAPFLRTFSTGFRTSHAIQKSVTRKSCAR